MQRTHVAAGILRNAGGQVLLTERIDDGPFYGLWEFPGGKIHADETARIALKRELLEEIGIERHIRTQLRRITASGRTSRRGFAESISPLIGRLSTEVKRSSASHEGE
jgi:mutator protein MutT